MLWAITMTICNNISRWLSNIIIRYTPNLNHRYLVLEFFNVVSPTGMATKLLHCAACMDTLYELYIQYEMLSLNKMGEARKWSKVRFREISKANSTCLDRAAGFHGPARSYFLMMTSSNGKIFRVTGPLCGEFTGLRWIPRTKASDAELRYFLWSAPN